MLLLSSDVDANVVYCTFIVIVLVLVVNGLLFLFWMTTQWTLGFLKGQIPFFSKDFMGDASNYTLV